MAMGFSADVRVPAPVKWALADDEVFRFDSGVGLTVEDLIHHFLSLGATGSGKTQSVALPILYRLFELGFAGLVVDLKGNLREKVRRLAWASGRQADLVEYGTGRYATPINVMAGLSFSETRALFEGICLRSFHGASNNLDFHMRGVSVLVDYARLLGYLHSGGLDVDVSVDFLAEMIFNQAHAQFLYAYFKQEIFDESNRDHVEFATLIDEDAIHPLHKVKPGDDVYQAHCEQVAYVFSCVRPALGRFLETPNIREKFCSRGCGGIDIERDLRARKIILLRFDPDTGPVGDDLARLFVNDFYKTVYNIGLDLPFPTFTLLDEYQEIADLGNSRFSDRRFVAMAREFRSSFIALTQSLAALGGKWGNDGIESLVSNCNSRVVFYSDDYRTQDSVSRYGDVDLTTLKPRQAFTVRYDFASRQHVCGIDTMDNEFAFAKEKLELGASLEVEPEIVESRLNPPLRDVVLLLKNAGGKAKGMKMEPVLKDGLVVSENAAMREIRENYSEFVGNVDFGIPVGWRERFMGALEALKASGLSVRINGLQMEGRGVNLDATGDELGIRLLKRLINGLSLFCPVCGKHVGEFSKGDIELCPDCLRNFIRFDEDKEENEHKHEIDRRDAYRMDWSRFDSDCPSM